MRLATEYKIVYEYKGQNNTSANRSVAFNRFVKSGDVDRNIGQIKSIVYEHWHTATKSKVWALRGQLVLADGTAFVSDQVSVKISGEIVKYVNTFSDLPTPEQFKTIAEVRTLDAAGNTWNEANAYAKLYWRATSVEPMRIIVTFVEEPPVVYAPEVTEFSVTRCDESSKPDDEGGFALVNLHIKIGDVAGLNNALLRIYYAANAYPTVGESEYIDLSDRISELLSGVENDRTIIPGEWDAGYSWYFAAVFIAGEESAVDTYIMPRAMGSFHVAPNQGGACVCGFSTGTKENPKFESYAPGYFYGGINGVTNYAVDEVETGGRWIDGRKIYRRVIEVNVTVLKTKVSFYEFPEAVEMIDMRGYVIRAGGAWRFPLCWYDTENSRHLVWMEDATTIMANTTAALTGHVIIEYVKTEEAKV